MVALRHTTPSDERCSHCKTGLSDKQRAVVVHQDPDPRFGGRYVHPVHKTCLLNAYRHGAIDKCWCGAKLDIEKLISIGQPQRAVAVRLRPVAVRDRITELTNEISSGMLYGVCPTFIYGLSSLIEMISPNQTMIQNSEVGIWQPHPATIVYGVSGAVVTFLGAGLVLTAAINNEPINALKKHVRYLSLVPISMACARDEDLQEKMAIIVLFIFAQLATAKAVNCLPFNFGPFEQIKKSFNNAGESIVNMTFFFKHEIALGAAIGLVARMIPLEEGVQERKIAATLLVSQLLIATTFIKGIWRACHPNRN